MQKLPGSMVRSVALQQATEAVLSCAGTKIVLIFPHVACLQAAEANTRAAGRWYQCCGLALVELGAPQLSGLGFNLRQCSIASVAGPRRLLVGSGGGLDGSARSLTLPWLEQSREPFDPTSSAVPRTSREAAVPDISACGRGLTFALWLALHQGSLHHKP